MSERIIRMAGMKAKVGIGRNAIYERLNPKSTRYDPTFPKPIKLGTGPAIGFVESEIDAWISTRMAERRTANRSRREPRTT